jgi:hypothetical protein
MPRDLTDEVHLFYKHAEWCSRQAKGVVNPEVREDFLRLAQKWLAVARCGIEHTYLGEALKLVG